MNNQYLSRPDVKQYLKKYPDITPEEKKELLRWIKDGNSPYYNDRDIFDADDRPVDFIDAIRAEREYWEEQYRIRHEIDTSNCACPP